MLKTLFSSLFTMLAPQLAIPGKIVSTIFSWRPSFFEITTIVAVLFITVDEVRINGLHIKPKLGFIHFTLVSVEGFKQAVVDLNNTIATMKTLEAVSHTAQIITNEQPQIGSKAIVENLNEQTPDISQKVDAALSAYIASHPIPKCDSVLGNQTTGVLISPTSVLGPSSITPGSNTNSLAPDMVAIPATDLQHYADAIKTEDKLHAYFQEMIREGYAIPFDDPSLSTTTAPSVSK